MEAHERAPNEIILDLDATDDPLHGQHGEINVRSQDNYEPAIMSIVRHHPPVTLAELQLAAKIASQIATIETASLAGGH
jgi:hypothetical protein